ncbi:MAG: HAD family hydrolase [Acidobacteria bacterium]|nr:HAD family hydrolase [Acidobacteriota bacterium]
MEAFAARPAGTVVFFDIDGTLLRRSGPHHGRALEAAALAITGRRVSTAGVPTQGMMDRTILELMLRSIGLPPEEIRIAMPRMVAAAQAHYVGHGPRTLRHRVCPGARATLTALRAGGVPLGLVTGNLSRIGWRKLAHAGLTSFFRFGAFAEQAEDRAGLVRRALDLARRQGWLSARTRVWHVGDHENDILAARANGVGSIAVATGVSPARDLAELRPDRLLRNLHEFRLELLQS